MAGTETINKMSCPNCGANDNFATIEKIIATVRAEYVTTDGNVEWKGETDWDDSETIGLICFDCNWEVEGIDWSQKPKQVKAELSQDQKILIKRICDDNFARGFISDDGVMDIADEFFATTKGSDKYVEKETAEDQALWDEAHKIAWDYIEYLSEKKDIESKISDLNNPLGEI